MGGMIAMAHVFHGQFGARIGLGNRRLQTITHGQGAAGKAATVHGLGEQGVGVLAAVRLDDHVEGFRHGQAHFVHLHRFDVLPSAATTVSLRPGMRKSK